MKGRLIHLLQHYAPPVSIDRLVRWTDQKLIFPFYHAILGESRLPHIQHLDPPRSEKQFIADLDFLLQHFTPIGMSDLLDHLHQGKPLPAKAFHLSFDDGLREVYDFAFPILKEKGIPASIFLNSAFVDNRALFFRYKASLLIDHLKNQGLEEKQLQEMGDLLHLKKPLAISGLIDRILKVKYAQRKILDGLATICQVNFDAFLKEQKPYLTTVQIKELIAHGFSFGAHSIDHPFYAPLSLNEQLEQTQASIDWVVQQFQLAYRCFAFPFTDQGVSTVFFEKIADQNIANLTFACAGFKQQNIPFHFQRWPIELYPIDAEKQLRGELWYYLLKKMLGKHRVKR